MNTKNATFNSSPTDTKKTLRTGYLRDVVGEGVGEVVGEGKLLELVRLLVMGLVLSLGMALAELLEKASVQSWVMELVQMLVKV